jgi:hypothetical protein
MTSNEFNALAFKDQTEEVLRGTFLADRQGVHHYTKLYFVSPFFVEVFFHDQNHLITHFRAFNDTMFALPYLKNLTIAV